MIPCDLRLIDASECSGGAFGHATKVVVVTRPTHPKREASILFLCDAHGTRTALEKDYDPAHFAFKARELTQDHNYIHNF